MATALNSRRSVPAVKVFAALACVVAAGGATAVASGALDGVPPERDETVIAHGVTPIAGPWRVSTYTNVETGEPCLRLVLMEAVTPIMGSGWCGEGDRAFQVSAIPVTLLDGRAEVLFYGVAPDTATEVQLIAAGGKQIAAPPEGATRWGRLWVLAAPPGLEGGTITWLDARGRRGSAAEDVSDQFRRTKRQAGIVERSGLEPD